MGAAAARDVNGEERANPYRIADSPWFTCINVSGGRSSAFMLRQVLAAHGGTLPARAAAVFANTGREREETLRFVHELGERWCPITWVEFDHDEAGAKGRKYLARVVDFATASRNGEPFDAMLRVSWLPSMTKRICTNTLKVETIDRYLWQAHGLTRRQSRKLIGFRHDEPRRWRPALYQECAVAYPMVEAGVTRADVAAFWQSQPFDLGIPSERGNCDACYLKPRANLLATIREAPHLADWWIAAERRAGRTFRQGEGYADLKAAALAGEADRGSGIADIGEPLPCFCTD